MECIAKHPRTEDYEIPKAQEREGTMSDMSDMNAMGVMGVMVQLERGTRRVAMEMRTRRVR